MPAALDLIGDLHGHADTLEALLRSLGYARTRGAWRHPEHLAVFVGDFLDRGPKIRETLSLDRFAGEGRVEPGRFAVSPPRQRPCRHRGQRATGDR